MELLTAIEKFTQETADSDAYYSHVCDRTKAFLWRYLEDLVRSPEDREDVIMETLSRIWGRRTSLAFPSLAAWWGYVTIAARRVAYDRLGDVQPNVELDEELSTEDSLDINAVAWLSETRDRLYAAADTAWLGQASSLQLLACQWHYVDRLSATEILRLLPEGSCTRNTLQAWLTDPDLCRHVAYLECYRSNEQLAAYLLRRNAPRELDELARALLKDRSQEGVPPWSALEARVILLRYRNGLLTEKIAQMEEIAEAAIKSVLEKVSPLLPFGALARQLTVAFSEAALKPCPLEEAKLYKRLVFQYYASDELPHKQILERTEPVAEVGNYHLTAGMLNVWLANGRLFKELQKHVNAEAVS